MLTSTHMSIRRYDQLAVLLFGALGPYLEHSADGCPSYAVDEVCCVACLLRVCHIGGPMPSAAHYISSSDGLYAATIDPSSILCIDTCVGMCIDTCVGM